MNNKCCAFRVQDAAQQHRPQHSTQFPKDITALCMAQFITIIYSVSYIQYVAKLWAEQD